MKIPILIYFASQLFASSCVCCCDYVLTFPLNSELASSRLFVAPNGCLASKSTSELWKEAIIELQLYRILLNIRNVMWLLFVIVVGNSEWSPGHLFQPTVVHFWRQKCWENLDVSSGTVGMSDVVV